MREFDEIYLDLTRAIKQLHEVKLKQDHVNAYLISCDVTDLSQELEDVLQQNANIQ